MDKIPCHGSGSTRCLMLALLICALPAARAQDATGRSADPRVADALKKVGLKYAVTSLGNYRLSFTLDDDRGHWVFVSSRTEKFGSLETRKIWASVAKFDKEPPQSVANKLLMENIPQKLGAYELSREDGGGFKLAYAARVDANSSGAALRDAVRIVMLVADAKEKELTNKDEF